MKMEPSKSQYELLSYHCNNGAMPKEQIFFHGYAFSPSISIHLPSFPHCIIHLFPDGTWRIVEP